MKRITVSLTLTVAAALLAAPRAFGDDLWPVPKSPCPQASGIADTSYAHGYYTDSWGIRHYRVRAFTSYAFQGLAPGTRYVLCAYNVNGTLMAVFGVTPNPDGTASGVENRMFDNLPLKLVRYRSYQLWTRDDRGNPVPPLVLSSQ